MRVALPRVVLSVVIVAVVSVALASCTKTARKRVPAPPETARSVTELYEQLKENQSIGNLDAAALDARQLIHYYPGFAKIDEALYRAAEIASAQGRYADAVVYLERLAEEQPLSPYRQQALILGARAQDGMGRAARSAELLVSLLAEPVDPDVREQATADLRRLVRTKLSESELQSLADAHPESPIVDEIMLDLARKSYARGDYDTCYRMLAEFLYRSPGNEQADEARRLLELASQRRQAHSEPPATIVQPSTVGVILPVTGKRSLYGRYFERGVRLALEHHNKDSSRHVDMIVVDSKGNPVSAVRGVRRLIVEEGATAILGSVFTMPTVAAAIEANAWRTPLLSPVVSTDDLTAIGPWIHRTKVPPAVEVSAIVHVAITRIGIERVAVIAPERGERHELGKLFADEAARLGAEVVAQVFYEEGATDFREQLDAVRETAPDAIFAPGTVEELLLLLPQIKFYDLQVKLFGLSNWNSDKLLRLSRGDLEGALFPLEAFHGTDPQAAKRFKAAMEESGVSEISPISEAGYFGMRLLLSSFDNGASSRDDVRAYLEAELRGGAERRMAQAQAMSIAIVRSGKVRPFNPPPPVDPFN